jgi:hypothetical protein
MSDSLNPKDYNFICIILGDNDFTSDMYAAMYSLKEHCSNYLKSLCPFTVKAFFIEAMLSHYKLKHILRGDPISDEEEKSIKKYFSGIRVLFNEKFPTIDIEGEIPCDHDGGAIYVDVNTGFISSF